MRPNAASNVAPMIAHTHSGMPRGRVRTPPMLAAQIVQMAACAIVVSYAAARAGVARPAAATAQPATPRA
jgi:hypothetical protein